MRFLSNISDDFHRPRLHQESLELFLLIELGVRVNDACIHLQYRDVEEDEAYSILSFQVWRWWVGVLSATDLELLLREVVPNEEENVTSFRDTGIPWAEKVIL